MYIIEGQKILSQKQSYDKLKVINIHTFSVLELIKFLDF